MSAGNDEGRPLAGPAPKTSNKDTTKVAPLSEALSTFEICLLADAFRQGSRSWWLKRAEDFEWAKPRVDDPSKLSEATLKSLRERWRRCDDIARACRAKASLLELEEGFAELVRDVA